MEYRLVVASDLVIFVDGPAGIGFPIVAPCDLMFPLFVSGYCGLKLRMDTVLTERLNTDAEVGQDKVAAVGAGEIAVGHALMTNSLEAYTRD